MRYAEIIVMRNHASLDQTFTYGIPEHLSHLVALGTRVMVPFGAEVLEGVVLNLSDEASVDLKRLKSIHYCFEASLSIPQELLDLATWIKGMYLSTYTEALQLILPTGVLIEADKLYTYLGDDTLDRIHQTTSMAQMIEALKLKQQGTLAGLNLPYSDALQKRNIKQLVAIGVVRSETLYLQKVKDRFISYYRVIGALEGVIDKLPEKYAAKRRAISYLERQPEGKLATLKEEAKLGTTVIEWLVKEGFISVEEVELKRMPEFMASSSAKREVILSEAQRIAIEAIEAHFRVMQERPVILQGVTGSGKTEVYMALIEKTLQAGKRAIFLVPEIALTPQMVSRLSKRFEGRQIALMHSKLSNGERFDQWKAMRAGEIDIVIGARSAIFAPVDDIGLIIMDEAHENSYRSERRPKYDTFEIAKMRAMHWGAHLLLGSATPSIDSVYATELGEMSRVILDARFNEMPPPVPEIIDMRKELEAGNKSMLSRRLFEAIEERLAKGEQTLIFLNRTGHSTFVSCRSCGFTLACPNCDITLTYHKQENKMSCHYCHHETFLPKKCPSCGSAYFKQFGVGTEKLEEALKSYFPTARVGRMDRTTTRKKGAFEALIEQVETEAIDILVGTQMVAKGLDFPKLTLVGIISVDLMMNMPHFQAGELTYQMVHQVSGRAGRAALAGEVILQTYQPEHYAIQHQTYDDFYASELMMRERLHYPPFCQMVNLLFLSRDEKVAKAFAEKSYQYLQANLLKKDLQSKVDLYEAHAALLKKIDGFYRYQVLLKVPFEEMSRIKGWVEKLQTRFVSIADCKINIDLNAHNIL